MYWNLHLKMDNTNRKAGAEGNISLAGNGPWKQTNLRSTNLTLESFERSIAVLNRSGNIEKTQETQLGALGTRADDLMFLYIQLCVLWGKRLGRGIKLVWEIMH